MLQRRAINLPPVIVVVDTVLVTTKYLSGISRREWLAALGTNSFVVCPVRGPDFWAHIILF